MALDRHEVPTVTEDEARLLLERGGWLVHERATGEGRTLRELRHRVTGEVFRVEREDAGQASAAAFARDTKVGAVRSERWSSRLG
jgi:hypothetical protein